MIEGLETKSIEEIYDAEQKKTLKEVFGTGTAVTIGKIKSITSKLGKIEINQHEITDKLKKSLLDIQYGESKDIFNWRLNIK